MTQPSGGISNVTPNAALVQMAMSYSRSRMLCAAARLAFPIGIRSELALRDERRFRTGIVYLHYRSITSQGA